MNDPRLIIGEIQQLTGKRYNIDFSKLDEMERREMLRLIRDCSSQVHTMKRQVRTQPWRFMR